MRQSRAGTVDNRRAEQGDVGGLGDEVQGGEVLDFPDVQVGLEGEVEVVEGLVVGQAGDVQGAGEAAVVFGGGFLAVGQGEGGGAAELGVVRALGQGGRCGRGVGEAAPGRVGAGR